MEPADGNKAIKEILGITGPMIHELSSDYRQLFGLANGQAPSVKAAWEGRDADEFTQIFAQFCGEIDDISKRLQTLAEIMLTR